MQDITRVISFAFLNVFVQLQNRTLTNNQRTKVKRNPRRPAASQEPQSLDEVLEEVRQLRAAIAVYRHLVKRRLAKEAA